MKLVISNTKTRIWAWRCSTGPLYVQRIPDMLMSLRLWFIIIVQAGKRAILIEGLSIQSHFVSRTVLVGGKFPVVHEAENLQWSKLHKGSFVLPDCSWWHATKTVGREFCKQLIIQPKTFLGDSASFFIFLIFFCMYLLVKKSNYKSCDQRIPKTN